MGESLTQRLSDVENLLENLGIGTRHINKDDEKVKNLITSLKYKIKKHKDILDSIEKALEN